MLDIKPSITLKGHTESEEGGDVAKYVNAWQPGVMKYTSTTMHPIKVFCKLVAILQTMPGPLLLLGAAPECLEGCLSIFTVLPDA
jgi:hypothetical protein